MSLIISLAAGSSKPCIILSYGSAINAGLAGTYALCYVLHAKLQLLDLPHH